MLLLLLFYFYFFHLNSFMLLLLLFTIFFFFWILKQPVLDFMFFSVHTSSVGLKTDSLFGWLAGWLAGLTDCFLSLFGYITRTQQFLIIFTCCMQQVSQKHTHSVIATSSSSSLLFLFGFQSIHF